MTAQRIRRGRRSTTILPQVVILALIGAGVPAANSTVAPESAAHLIICPASLASAFEPLAEHRTQTGTPSAVLTLEQILASTPPGRDDAETLRKYLVQVHGAGTLRFVLLGGDGTVMPVRVVRNTFYPAGGSTDLAADIYFAALERDWDADGDGIFGEPFLSSTDPGDNADLDPEVAVGRAPVQTPAQAERVVQGVLTYEHPGQGAHVGSAVLMAEVLFPADWSGGTVALDGASFAQSVRAQLEGLASPMSTTRLYENFTAYAGSQPLSPAAVLAAMGSGLHGTVFNVGAGGQQTFSEGSGMVTVAQVDALANAPNYFVMIAMSSSAGDFRSGAILTHLATAPNGGSVASLGFTAPMFPVTAWDYVEDFLVAATPPGGARLGDALQAALHAHAGDTFINTASRWTSMSVVLLGDPATPYRTEPGPVPTPRASLGALKRRFR